MLYSSRLYKSFHIIISPYHLFWSAFMSRSTKIAALSIVLSVEAWRCYITGSIYMPVPCNIRWILLTLQRRSALVVSCVLTTEVWRCGHDRRKLSANSCVQYYLHKRNAAQGVTLKTQRMLSVVSGPWGCSAFIKFFGIVLLGNPHFGKNQILRKL